MPNPGKNRTGRKRCRFCLPAWRNQDPFSLAALFGPRAVSGYDEEAHSKANRPALIKPAERPQPSARNHPNAGVPLYGGGWQLTTPLTRNPTVKPSPTKTWWRYEQSQTTGTSAAQQRPGSPFKLVPGGRGWGCTTPPGSTRSEGTHPAQRQPSARLPLSWPTSSGRTASSNSPLSITSTGGDPPMWGHQSAQPHCGF